MCVSATVQTQRRITPLYRENSSRTRSVNCEIVDGRKSCCVRRANSDSCTYIDTNRRYPFWLCLNRWADIGCGHRLTKETKMPILGSNTLCRNIYSYYTMTSRGGWNTCVARQASNRNSTIHTRRSPNSFVRKASTRLSHCAALSVFIYCPRTKVRARSTPNDCYFIEYLSHVARAACHYYTHHRHIIDKSGFQVHVQNNACE